MFFGNHTTLNYNTCLGLNTPDRTYHASELETLSAIERTGTLNPIQSRRLSELRESGYTGSLDGVEYGGQGNLTPEGYVKQAQKAVQPAVDSLNQSIPEINQRFTTERERLESEKAPLTQRYDQLIAEIKGEKAKAETGTVRNLSREFSRRGIPLSSTVYGSEVEGALNPIRSEYTNLETKTGFEREAGLKGISDLITKLVGDETGAVRDVRNAIAQLQAGAGSQGIGNALQFALAQMSGDIQKQSIAETARQNTIANELATKKFNEYEMPYLKYLINKPYYNPSTGSSSSSTPTTSLSEIFG